jgi:hypothetical protein
MEPKFDAPFPLWLIFPVFFVALYLSHLTLLSLPYYWDEAGYYIPAAWDFFRTGSLIPTSTLSNAHPPLPSIYLALWWKASGYAPAVTREAVLLVAAFALLAVWRLVNRVFDPASLSSSPLNRSSSAEWIAFTTVVLTALYPIWFAQSTLAHADIFAAACTLWGLVYSLPDHNRRAPLAAAWFAAAVLCKETAIVIPLTLAMLVVWEALRSKSPSRAKFSESLWLLTPILPLAAWFLFHYFRTGFFFGNPEFLRYNAEANLTPLRFLAALAHRVLHLTAHMNLFVPVLLGFAALLLPPQPGPDGRTRPTLSSTVLRRIFALLIANAILFSILGGALLCRYLLPMYPLVLLLAVTAIYRRVRFWPALAGLSAAAFVAGIFINPPYGFAPEDNLAYARMIRLHQAAIRQLQSNFSGSTVLSAWPATDELSKPELGYVKTPFAVFPIDDFSSPQITRAAATPGSYSTALVFSTKIDPPSPVTLGPFSGQLDEQYFGLHHDLSPEAIASQLGGTLTWQGRDQNQWAAVLRFHRQYEAQIPNHPGIDIAVFAQAR